MLTVIFSSIGSIFEEISSSVVKFSTTKKTESVYTASCINMLFGGLAFAALIAWRHNFVFVFASLPTFLLRAVLEIAQTQVATIAVMKADRSTFAFGRNLTIPLLLLTDFLVGFKVTPIQITGIVIILSALFIATLFRVTNLRGIGYILFIAINAVFTISLFKYNTTHFNSVAGEQIMIYCVLILYFFCAAKIFAHENPFVFLKKKIFFAQGAANGVSAVFSSFAIAFGNPGVAITAERSSAVLTSIFSGHYYFAEQKLRTKVLIATVLIIGLILLAG